MSRYAQPFPDSTAKDFDYVGRHACNAYCSLDRHTTVFYTQASMTMGRMREIFSGVHVDAVLGAMELEHMEEATEALPVLDYNRLNGFRIYPHTHLYTKAFTMTFRVVETEAPV